MTKNFVMTHKKFHEPQNSDYVPLHVGRVLGKDLGYLGDDIGNSISELNGYYGELTGVYWIWKNYTGRENIGVCHYRRFFVDRNRELLSGNKCDQILIENDIITPKTMTVEESSYREYYSKAHNIHDLEEEARIIQRLYPEDYPVFCKVMNGREHYYGNLMVTKREIFDAYCTWLFSIFFELEKVIDVSSYDTYRKRVFGFLSEQLLMVWIRARNLKVYENDVLITSEKAETIELKLAMGHLLKANQITEARKLFYNVLKVRPDLSMEISDIKQELYIIEQILYICEEEELAGKRGMLAYTKELKKLIEHYRTLVECLKRYQGWTQKDIQYLKDTKVTDIAIEVIGRNHHALEDIWQKALERYVQMI